MITIENSNYKYDIIKINFYHYKISIIENNRVLCVFDYYVRKNKKPKIKSYTKEVEIIKKHIQNIQKFIEGGVI